MNLPKILLVDDTAFFLQVEKSILSVSPVSIITAADGEQALQMVREERPDLVIMDIVMPRMDGRKCCSLIKSDPELCHIPVVMVTTSDRPEDVQACREAGCNDFISKPLERKLFLEKVKRFLPAIERRKTRIECRVPVRITYDTIVMEVESHDLSFDGMYVRSSQSPEAGTRLEYSFSLPGETDKVIRARGHVAWVNNGKTSLRPGMPSGFGIELNEIVGEGLPLLRKNELTAFIESQGK